MKKILYSLMVLTLLLASCNTIEDREELGPILKPDQLIYSVTQPEPGSNTIILENKTPNVLQYWDWGTGFSNKLKDTIYIPFSGTFKIKFTAFCAGGTVTDSSTFTVDHNDDAYFDQDPLWKALTGGGSGKTWVFALDHPSGLLAGNGPEDCIIPGWWTMSPASYNQSSTDDEIYMDLNSAANFERKHGDGSIERGFFNIIAPYVNGTDTFHAFEVVGGPTFPWPNTDKYHVTNINENELSLHEYKGYNIALYKQKGFVY
jgi:hypothetical protein